MINIPPIKPSTTFSVELLPEISKTWKINQVVNATTEKGGEALSKVVLRIGQQLFDAQTPIKLQTGDPITLVIKSLGSTPLLSIQTPATETITPVAEKLKLFIAQQLSLPNLAKLLPGLISENKFPMELKLLLNNFVRNLPTKESLQQPTNLKTFIQNSGVFLESKLAKETPTSQQYDTKAQLIKISQLIQTLTTNNSPPINDKDIKNLLNQLSKNSIPSQQLATKLIPLLNSEQLSTLETQLKALSSYTAVNKNSPIIELLNQLVIHIKKHSQAKQITESLLNTIKNHNAIAELKLAVDNALSAITSQQLTPLLKESDNFLLLLFGLLIKDKNHIDVVNMKIEEQTTDKETENKSWFVSVNFDFKKTGKIQADLHLTGSNISAVFSSENKSTYELIKNNLGHLNNAFKKIGFCQINLEASQQKIHQQNLRSENIQLLNEDA